MGYLMDFKNTIWNQFYSQKWNNEDSLIYFQLIYRAVNSVFKI